MMSSSASSVGAETRVGNELVVPSRDLSPDSQEL
jgi:hypothetical protein